MRPRALKRAAALVVLAAAAVAAAAIITGGGDTYVLYAQFRDAGGLRQGFTVRIDGAPVGQVAGLRLDSHDRVVAKLSLDKRAAPVGADVRATVRAADLLGEKYVDLQPGDRRRAAPSGSVVPPSRTGLAVELDDFLNAIDVPTQNALRAFISEQGNAFAGRGGDLAGLLSVLPASLDQTGQLLGQFAHDNRALGQLVDESDRVIGVVAHERGALGRLVGAAAGTLGTLASRQRELGRTVARAPALLAATRRALAALEGAAIPLGPAAQGLSSTAPQLTATLHELPTFAAATRPTLDIVRRVAPTLGALGRLGAPVVQALGPLTRTLGTFATAFDPVTKTFDTGAPDVLGVLEGWARATQARDAASHVFRFGLTVSADTFSSLAPLLGPTETATASRHSAVPVRASAPSGSTRAAPASVQLAKASQPATSGAGSAAVGLRRLPQVLAQLGLGGASSGTGGPPSLQDLLNYLLK
jgi:virulence factor Mce-like protein